jgi:hypothetical protein
MVVGGGGGVRAYDVGQFLGVQVARDTLFAPGGGGGGGRLPPLGRLDEEADTRGQPRPNLPPTARLPPPLAASPKLDAEMSPFPGADPPPGSHPQPSCAGDRELSPARLWPGEGADEADRDSWMVFAEPPAEAAAGLPPPARATNGLTHHHVLHICHPAAQPAAAAAPLFLQELPAASAAAALRDANGHGHWQPGAGQDGFKED